MPKLIGAGHDVEPYVPWLLSEMSRNDPFAMVDAGRALARYDARPWASSLGVPAASLITTEDRLVRPAKQRALAAGARRRRAASSPPTTSPRCRTRDQFAALTVELVDSCCVSGRRRRRPPPSDVA